jgi:bifunctional UDP-N-acetylglucosamine pyrophosphorylase/glucosamine-1-phosphate N-acetyltransferase
MKSELPKVLHPLGGRSLVQRVLESCQFISPVRQLVIVGYRGDLVQESLTGVPGLEFVTQSEQLGTGHAVQQILPHLEGFDGDLVVLNGDVPLLRPETIRNLLETHQTQGNGATILTAQHPHPKGYGRVFSDSDNLLQQIVEDRDCTTAQRQNRRINAGVYCFNWPQLAQVLPQLKSENDQQEYYLTDAVNYLDRVMVVDVEDYQEILGINDRKQLATAHQILQDRIKEDWMKAGVTLIDPDSITIDDTVRIASDVLIEPQTHIRGNTVIGTGCRIGPGSLIENSQIGEQVTVLYSVISDSVVNSNTRIGPYAHLRGHAEIGEGCRVGNFVEIKKSQVGDRTNIAHLSYIGDAELGQQVNVGAGTITANYDGYQKHKTVIGDRTKTGSNSVLVAPITIGEDVTIGAGSVVTKDVQNDALVVARAPQKVRPGWRPKGVS